MCGLLAWVWGATILLAMWNLGSLCIMLPIALVVTFFVFVVGG